MEILQKNPYLLHGYSHLPPTVQHPQLIPRVQFLTVGYQCEMTAIKHQPVTAPENTWPLCDPKMSNFGGFGPKLISLYCLRK